MKSVFLSRQHRRLFTPIAGDEAKFTEILGRNEATLHQAEATQGREPFRIHDVGFPSWHMFDVVSVNDPGRNAWAG